MFRYQEADSYSGIEILPKRYTHIATPTNGANAIKGIPSVRPNFASRTIEPVASTTTAKVPITSAKNFF